MHKIFLEKLKDSYSESKFVIAINVDVRGFSKFSKNVESAQSALFIKKIFINILNNFYQDASFYKSTGDGLIIIYDVEEKNLTEVSNKVLRISLSLANQFPKLCSEELMINFKVPDYCGIGISRGPATCLRTLDLVLDYTGDALNIASRLMECARPSGLIFDSNLGINLIEEDIKKSFKNKNIYLKGVSENEPIKIWYTFKNTKINDNLLKPVNGNSWKIVEENFKLKQIKDFPSYIFYLKNRIINPEEIIVEISHQAMRNKQIIKDHEYVFDFPAFEYIDRGNISFVELNFIQLAKELNKNGVPDNMNVCIEIKYKE